MHEIQTFTNGPLKADVRTVLINGVVWFVLTDVARALGYRDAANARHLLRSSQWVQADDAIKQALGVRGSAPYLVTEGGLYRLALRSSKEEAAPFQEWVEDDVLVTVRKAHSVGIDVLNEAKRAYEGRIRQLEAGSKQFFERNELEHQLQLEAKDKETAHWSDLIDKQEKLIEEMERRMRLLGARGWDIPDIEDM